VLKPGGDGAGPAVTDVIQLFPMVTLGRMIEVLPVPWSNLSPPVWSAHRPSTRRRAAS
jgi:hypothetical protein